MKRVTGIILAGGKSKRMGVNKALLTINGEKNIEHIKKKMMAITNQLIVIANTPDDYKFLNVPIVKDVIIDKGPLAGIHSGLLASENDWNLFAACDLPFFNKEVARYYIDLINSFNNENIGAIIPYINGQRHPLFAAYHKKILPFVEKSLSMDKLAIANVLDQINVHEISEKDFIQAGFTMKEIEEAFFNMNRPEDYEFVMKRK